MFGGGVGLGIALSSESGGNSSSVLSSGSSLTGRGGIGSFEMDGLDNIGGGDGENDCGG